MGKRHHDQDTLEVGLDAPRNMTNCPGSVLFFICWGLLLFLIGVAYKHGDIARLIYGADYLGNVCAQGTPEGVFPEIRDTWHDRQNVWFPVAYNTTTDSFTLDSGALKLGICVSTCPSSGETLSRYGTDPTYAAHVPHTVSFDSTSVSHHCIPSLAQFDCHHNLNCVRQREEFTHAYASAIILGSMGRQGLAAIAEHWWIVAVSGVLALFLSAVWLALMRQIIKPLVAISIVGILSGLAVLGGLLLQQYLVTHTTPQSHSTGYLCWAIIVWVLDFVFLCVVIYLRKEIISACGIVVEAARVPTEMPSMVLIPPLLFTLIVPFAIFGVFNAAVIHTVGANALTSVFSSVQVQQYVPSNWRCLAQLYNTFMTLWTLGLLHAFGLMVASFCAVFWYWSCPGERKSTEHGVLTGARYTLRYHFGTVAIGSLVVTIIGIIRMAMRLVEAKLRRLSRNANALRFLVSCADCCLACFDRLIRYVNRNVYIMCCLTGESFLPAARHGVSLLVQNIGTATAVNLIGDVVMFLGKLFVTATVTLLAYVLLPVPHQADSQARNGMLLVLAVCALLAYVIASVFINVFGVCIDTLFLSYCYDMDVNNGRDRPYFFPRGIAQHIEEAQRCRPQSVSEEDENAPILGK